MEVSTQLHLPVTLLPETDPTPASHNTQEAHWVSQIVWMFGDEKHPLPLPEIGPWINQLSNTTIRWLDICCLLHRYQLHVSVLTAIFRLIDWQQTCKQLYFGVRLVYGGEGLGLDGGTRSCVCWVGRVMWVYGYYCAGLRKHKIKIQVDRLTTNL